MKGLFPTFRSPVGLGLTKKVRSLHNGCLSAALFDPSAPSPWRAVCHTSRRSYLESSRGNLILRRALILHYSHPHAKIVAVRLRSSVTFTLVPFLKVAEQAGVLRLYGECCYILVGFLSSIHLSPPPLIYGSLLSCRKILSP